MLAKFPIIFPMQNLAVSGKVCIFAANYTMISKSFIIYRL